MYAHDITYNIIIELNKISKRDSLMRCLNPRLCYFVSTIKNKAPNFNNKKRQDFTESRFLASFTLVTSLLFPFRAPLTL